jgi:hypothetical protein
LDYLFICSDGENLMRTFLALLFMTLVVVAPTYSFAADDKDGSMTDKAVTVVKDNPGVSVGVAACGVAIAFFPPALLICGGALVAGAGVDHTSK